MPSSDTQSAVDGRKRGKWRYLTIIGGNLKILFAISSNHFSLPLSTRWWKPVVNLVVSTPAVVGTTIWKLSCSWMINALSCHETYWLISSIWYYCSRFCERRVLPCEFCTYDRLFVYNNSSVPTPCLTLDKQELYPSKHVKTLPPPGIIGASVHNHARQPLKAKIKSKVNLWNH